MKLIVVAATLAAFYAAACWVSPYVGCVRCGGAGTRKGWILKRDVDCWWCNSTGRRLRIGRRVYNHGARLRREGQARRTERASAKQ